MNNFIERIDERLRGQQALVIDKPDAEMNPYDMRLAAEALLQHAAENRDKASCVKGPKQRSMITLAERKELEAERLLLAADRILSAYNTPYNNNTIPVQEKQHMEEVHHMQSPMHMDRGNNYMNQPCTQYMDNNHNNNTMSHAETPRRNPCEMDRAHMETIQRQNSAELMHADELLARAAENRDKATCVRGGKQRALLNIAEKLENDALTLRRKFSQSDILEESSFKNHYDHDVSTLPTEKSQMSEAMDIPLCHETHDVAAIIEQITLLENDALLCRDKASCVSGPRHRQLINFAEMKERKATDLRQKIGPYQTHKADIPIHTPEIGVKAAGLNSRGVNRQGSQLW